MTSTSQSQWYVRSSNGISGPYTPQKLKEFADNGKLPRSAQVAKSAEGPWTIAENVKGLFAVPSVAAPPPITDDESMRPADFVPNVVKNSASALSTAVSGFSKGIISQAKKIESGLSTRADKITTSINVLCADGQDPTYVEKIAVRVKEICTRDEEILYIAVQSKPIANFTPDSVVLTNKRFIIFRPKLLGRMSFVDCLWRDCKDVHTNENMIGATLAFAGMSGHVETLDYIPKAQARMIYRHAQEMEEQAFDTRRNMKMEELKAGADKTVINQAIGMPTASQQPASIAEDDIVAKMCKLKSLLENGLISQAEFDTKRQSIIDSI